MIKIDGSHKSGSGTIVRDAVPFSALTGKELRITNIRAKRGKPGLRAQHLKGIEASAQISQGQLTGAELGSREIIFKPGPLIHGGSFRWDIGTAGSTTMLALSVIPLALFADKPSHFTIRGGIFQDFAPSVYHVIYVLVPVLKKMGARLDIEIIQPGYVPKGRGRIEVSVLPLLGCLKPVTLIDRGKILEIKGIALSSLLAQRKVSERMAGACRRALTAAGYDPEIEIFYDRKENAAYKKPSIQAGASLALWARTDTGAMIGADMAGARGRPAEFIGKEVAKKLSYLLTTEATVDEHVADQLIPFAALAEGWSSYIIPEMTDHIETRLWLAEELLGATTEVTGNLVRIQGIGFRR